MAAAALDVDIERVATICRRYGVTQLALFGSFSRGEVTAESDVDLLYDLDPGARLGWEIEALAEELAAEFGRPVDLVARRALHGRLRDRVLAEAVSLHAS